MRKMWTRAEVIGVKYPRVVFFSFKDDNLPSKKVHECLRGKLHGRSRIDIIERDPLSGDETQKQQNVARWTADHPTDVVVLYSDAYGEHSQSELADVLRVDAGTVSDVHDIWLGVVEDTTWDDVLGPDGTRTLGEYRDRFHLLHPDDEYFMKDPAQLDGKARRATDSMKAHDRERCEPCAKHRRPAISAASASGDTKKSWLRKLFGGGREP